MNVRYFAAARAAAGTDEEKFELPDGATLPALLEAILAVERPEPPEGTPPLARILSRSSFLLNEVAVRDQVAAALAPDDVVDVLPPFAGG
ncbi:MAG: MoaD/ThiS family protein [Arthrobacter sp.]|nr:MoaD/ThiS family protein [Arthrobacter sp.]